MTRLLLGLALGLAFLCLHPGQSQADGWGGHRGRGPSLHYQPRWGNDWWHRGHWHRGYHDGRLAWWWVIGPSWYFYPAPVYPYPPQVVVVPVPAPAPPPQAAAAPPEPYCREYQGDAIINGTNQRFYGTACLQPDGSWRIVH